MTPPHHTGTDPATEAGPELTAFLVEFLGAWPPTEPLTVVGSPARTRPGWDGRINEVIGVASPVGTVLSVRPDRVATVRACLTHPAELADRLGQALGRPSARTMTGTFRWTVTPADLPDAGQWLPATDPRVPEWLHPFGGIVLVHLIGGQYAAGVGIKRHNPAGLELSVGTEPPFRGRGLAARLVAQAARWVIAQGAVPIYLHDPANVASDRTAWAAGFPDLGWRIVGLAGG